MLIKFIREVLGRVIIFFSFLTRPKQVKRSEAEQSRVNETVRGLSLYQFYACPFCVKVRRTIHRLNLPVETRDAQNDPGIKAELLQEGGSSKVPCLRIENNEGIQWMYESSDIVDYLEARFGVDEAVAS